MAISTLGELDRLRPALKTPRLDGIFAKIVRALSCEPQGVDVAKLGYEVSPIVSGKTVDAGIDAPRFTMMDALVVEGLATGFVRF